MPLYVPNPDRGSVEELIEELARELTERYRAAEDELIREIAARAIRDMRLAQQLPTADAGSGLTVAERRRQNRILAELAAHRAVAVRELQARAVAIVEQLRAEDLARRVIESAAREGEAAAAAQLGFATRQVPAAVASQFIGGITQITTTTLSSTASQAAAALVLSLDSRLDALNWRITRYPRDAYQRIVSLYTPNTILGVTTSRVSQAQAVQRFLAEGIPGFVDRAGRAWTIGSYAEMAGRTSVNRAFNDAATWRMQQSGVNLVTIVRGLDSCPRCAEWAGKILSTDGQTGHLVVRDVTGGTIEVDVAATVDNARAAGWNHPNCRCRLAPYLPGVSSVQDDTTYDEAAEKERAQQRALEREIRAAKRREATALDDVSRARARAQVRAAQGDMRDFIRRTGRNRDSYREQLHFAFGKGSTPPPMRVPSGPVQFHIAKNSPLGAAARHSVSQVRAVHTIPSDISPVALARMPAAAARVRPTVIGSYRRNDGALWLRDGDDVELTAVHELGHWLDNKLLGDDRMYGSDRLDTPGWARWSTAVASSTPTQYLQRVRALDHPDVTAELVEHIGYMLRPREQFARSYAQWIATRTGDRILLDQLRRFQTAENYTLRAYQWPDDEFEEIAAALDDIFRERGLLK